jgi:hypothetical protein
MDPSALMLRWHQWLSHVSLKRIQLMAKNGQLPKSLATCRIPLCQACKYGKASRRNWRTKPSEKDGESLFSVTRPGQCVSVDQLESATLGFFGQLKGRLMRQRFKAATIFVDHFSDLSYTHLQQSTLAKETLEAKAPFEAFDLWSINRPLSCGQQ